MKHCLYHCLLLTVALWTLSHSAAARPGACEALTGAQRKLANEILQSEHPYDCCDGTLAQCLRRKPVCRLARRLSEDVCRRVAAGQSRVEITRELSRRATSMLPSGTTYRTDTKALTPSGSSEAKVTAVAYLCARCPFCARVVPDLHRSVTTGRLAGKVKLYARLFPVRSHADSTEAALGLGAAQRLGKFWEFLLYLYQNFDHFEKAKLGENAAAVGMDQKRFLDAMADPVTRQSIVDSKKEGVRNKVDSTPTFFINGRRYSGELNLSALEDVLEEEHDRVTGKQYE